MIGDIEVTRVQSVDRTGVPVESDQWRSLTIVASEIAAVASAARSARVESSVPVECSQILMRNGSLFSVEETRDKVEEKRRNA